GEDGDQGQEPGGQPGGGGDQEADGDQEGNGQPKQGKDHGNCGGIRPPGDTSESAAKESESNWDVNLSRAEQQAKQRGTLAGGLSRLVKQMFKRVVDVAEKLREFMTRPARNDYSWQRPNRRFIHMGLYLPGLYSLDLGEVLATFDTSGS